MSQDLGPAPAPTNTAPFTPIQQEELWIRLLVPGEPAARYADALTFVLEVPAPARTHSVSVSQGRKTSNVCSAENMLY